MNALEMNRRERGEVTSKDVDPFLVMSIGTLCEKMKSPIATIRTSVAIALGEHKTEEITSILCEQLRIEKKLYCKIAISDSLVKMGTLSVKPLLKLLGEIGNNQEKEIPQKGFNKTSYPLPRDISARILCRMGKDIVSDLLLFLEKEKDTFQIEQAIDVIGHIIYTAKIDMNPKPLLDLSRKYPSDQMIQYKIIRSLSGFNDVKMKDFLCNYLESSDTGLQFEAVRSLILSGQNVEFNTYKLSDDIITYIKSLNSKLKREVLDK